MKDRYAIISRKFGLEPISGWIKIERILFESKCGRSPAKNPKEKKNPGGCLIPGGYS
jgi:hypothetical protein